MRGHHPDRAVDRLAGGASHEPGCGGEVEDAFRRPARAETNPAMLDLGLGEGVMLAGRAGMSLRSFPLAFNSEAGLTPV
jgi:hypothetical protein